MDPRNLNFIAAVLGAEGATALIKALDRSSDLKNALLPRTIIAWLQSASMYEGDLPGIDNSFLSFQKGQRGFTGMIRMDGSPEVHQFSDASIFHVAGAVGVALGLDSGDVPATISAFDIERLGKSIDLLAKIERVKAEKKKRCSKNADCLQMNEHEGDCGPEPDMKKAGTGVPAAPTAPKPPTPPTAPNTSVAKPKPTKPGKSPAMPTMKLTRSEAEHECPSCGIPQFHKNVFRGCLCFSAFAKSVHVVSAEDDAIVLRFESSDWGPDELLTLRESMGKT